MGIDGLLTLLVLAGAVILFVTERLPVDVVAMIVLASLLILGLVTPAQALSGFSSEATITVAAMFVLSAGLAHTGALLSVGRLFGRVKRPWLFMLLIMFVVGPISAFVNNTAAVAVFLPLVLAATAANRSSPSQVLIPLSYAAQMGGVCTLIGTSTNLLVNSLAKDLGHPGFGLFDFAPVGVITMGVGFAYLLLMRRWLLPHHPPAPLTEAYELGKYITELRVMPGSPLIGKSVAQAQLAEKRSVYVLELMRGEQKHWSPRAEELREGDVLLVRGNWEQLKALKDEFRLELEPEFKLQDSQFTGEDGEQAQVLVEAMVAPGARLVGRSLAELDFQWAYNATVLALHRRGEVLREKIKDVSLNVGDVLLLMCTRAELDVLRTNNNLVVLNERGEVIGINTAIRADANGIGFAIPINQAKDVKDILAKGGEVPHPYVGIQMVTLTPELAKQNNNDPNSTIFLPETNGVLVMRVMPNTPAEAAGIRRGDVITKVENKAVSTAAQLQEIVARSNVNQSLRFEIQRGSQSLTLTVRTAQLRNAS